MLKIDLLNVVAAPVPDEWRREAWAAKADKDRGVNSDCFVSRFKDTRAKINWVIAMKPESGSIGGR